MENRASRSPSHQGEWEGHTYCGRSKLDWILWTKLQGCQGTSQGRFQVVSLRSSSWRLIISSIHSIQQMSHSCTTTLLSSTRIILEPHPHWHILRQETLRIPTSNGSHLRRHMHHHPSTQETSPCRPEGCPILVHPQYHSYYVDINHSWIGQLWSKCNDWELYGKG